MTKLELAQEIFRVQNEVKILDGEQPVDLAAARWKIQEMADKSCKAALEQRLAGLQASAQRQKDENELAEKLAAYFATPQGAAFKAETERALEEKIKEWQEYEAAMTTRIESRIQTDLGSHWGIIWLNKGFLDIGVIDEAASTPESREYLFGQHIEIRYDEAWGKPRFESNCGSCGSFDMEGGGTVGQRAMFYAGIGRLYSDAELVAFIKDCLKEETDTIDRYSKELDSLRNKLNNPFAE